MFTVMESQESPLFNFMLSVKILQAMPKPWQVQYEINIEIGITFLLNLRRCCVVKLNISLKDFRRFLCAAYQREEETLGFPTI